MSNENKANKLAEAATKKLKEENYRAALDLFNESLNADAKMFQNNVYFFSRRAEANKQLGNIDEAIRDAQRAYELAAGEAYFSQQLAALYRATKQYDQALELMQPVIDMHEEKTGGRLLGTEKYDYLEMAAICHEAGKQTKRDQLLGKAAELGATDIDLLAYESLYDDLQETGLLEVLFI